MKNGAFEMDGVTIPMLEIEMQDEMEHLVSILANNSYEVQVTPVYETLEDLKTSGYRGPINKIRPCVKYYSVKILGFIEKPKYEE